MTQRKGIILAAASSRWAGRPPSPPKVALITGQGGSYLAEFLFEKGRTVNVGTE
jgi:hypothetical protein